MMAVIIHTGTTNNTCDSNLELGKERILEIVAGMLENPHITEIVLDHGEFARSYEKPRIPNCSCPPGDERFAYTGHVSSCELEQWKTAGMINRRRAKGEKDPWWIDPDRIEMLTKKYPDAEY